ncbi:peptidoglycan-binding protein, partial [Patescibacteria group bacterium]|nr:peptidoglycan-binding protein [Patescibacteria group bacterium]
LVVPSLSSAATVNEISAQIDILLQQVQQLQSQLQSLINIGGSSGSGSTSSPTPTPSTPAGNVAYCFPSLSYNLYLGITDNETENQVSQLQHFLAQWPNIYPEGLITGYFGPLTETAVKKFQCNHGIVCSGAPETTGYGVVGPVTKLKIKALCGNEASLFPTPTPSATPVSTPTPTPTPIVSDGSRNITISMVLNGKVVSNPLGINCGPGLTQCQTSFNGNVVLTATPSSGYSLTKWSGCTVNNQLRPGFSSDCIGNSGTCTINALELVSNPEVGPLWKLSSGTTLYAQSVYGWGKITDSKGFICEGSGNKICTPQYTVGEPIIFTATPMDIYSFQGWAFGYVCGEFYKVDVPDGATGCGTNLTCTLPIPYSSSDIMSGIKACFEPPSNYIQISSTAIFEGGYVSDNYGKLKCGTYQGSSIFSCGYSYAPTDVVTFTAYPAPGYSLYSWSGCYRVDGTLAPGCNLDCKDVSSRTCTINMAELGYSSKGIGWKFKKD